MSKPSFTAAEQRQLDLLMAKKAQAVEASKALAGQSSSMTDAAKRRCTADEDSLHSWDEGEFISEQLTLEALKASEESAGSPGNIPESTEEPKHRDPSAPCPKGLTFDQWSKTLITMTKYKKDKFSFKEIYMKAAADVDCRRYCSWLLKTYATTEAMATTTSSDGCPVLVKQPVTQAAKSTPDEDISTSFKLQQCLRRRATAYEFASLISFSAHEKYIDKLLRRLHTEPPPNYQATSMAQILRADREVWVYMSQNVEDIKQQADGSRPVDKALGEALADYNVTFHLLPLPLPSSSSYAPVRNRENFQSESNYKGKAGAFGRKGKGKSKGSQGSSVAPRGIKGAVGRDAKGRAICFNYNLGERNDAPDQMAVIDWIKHPAVKGVFLAPPCGTASTARQIELPGQDAPKPLRWWVECESSDQRYAIVHAFVLRLLEQGLKFNKQPTLQHAAKAATMHQTPALKLPPLVPPYKSRCVSFFLDDNMAWPSTGFELQCLKQPHEVKFVSVELFHVAKRVDEELRAWKMEFSMQEFENAHVEFDKFVVFGMQWDIIEFLERAMTVKHPVSALTALPAELLQVVESLVTMGPLEVSKVRLKFFQKWNARAKELEAEEQMRATMDSGVSSAVAGKRILLFEETLQF
eukprot:s4341_g5.t1